MIHFNEHSIYYLNDKAGKAELYHWFMPSSQEIISVQFYLCSRIKRFNNRFHKLDKVVTLKFKT